MNKLNLVDEVSIKEPVVYGKGNATKILALDCGIKYNIIRHLVKRGAEVKVVPWNYDFLKEVDAYDGLFISNGPGDPQTVKQTTENLRKLVNDPKFTKPIFGICLGNQLLGLAAGKANRATHGVVRLCGSLYDAQSTYISCLAPLLMREWWECRRPDQQVAFW